MDNYNLRNRRQTKRNGATINGSVECMHDEGTGLLDNVDGDYEDEEDDHHTDTPFQLTPLAQRAIVMRLDVGPFLLAYAGLITLDTLDPLSEWALHGVQCTTIAFAGTLLLHLVIVLWTQWSVLMKSDVGYHIMSDPDTMSRWTHCLVHPEHRQLHGNKIGGIVPVFRDSDNVIVVVFQDRTYRYCVQAPDADVGLWEIEKTVKKLSLHSVRFRSVNYPIHLPIPWYGKWQGHLTLQSAVAASHVYGRNTTALQLPTFFDLLAQQMIAPFFLFQVFCVVLWSLDEYWYYALFTLFALILFESTLAYNRLKSLERLHAIGYRHQHQRVWVRRGMDVSKVAWMSIPVSELVPGDFVSLTGNQLNVPADILLLHGTAVCDEALLTGESVPQLKQAIDLSSGTNETLLDIKDGTHKESILFGGTVLLVGSPPSDTTAEQSGPNMGIAGIVLRTGFETAQGNLLRTMAHSSASSDGVHTMDTFVFIFLLVLCAIGAAAYVLNEGWYDERRNRFRLILHVVIIVTSVVPPELPMELSLAVTNSVADLMRRCNVFCTEHFRIPWAGEVNVCCFDKTGTL
jgi:E1-E2 ATPase